MEPSPLQQGPGLGPPPPASAGGGSPAWLLHPESSPVTPASSPQFRRSQEATLAHLRLVASNHSPSLDIEARFQSLAQENQAMALALSRSQAVVQGDLGHLKTWMRKMQRRSRKLDRRLLALDAALGEGSTRREREQEAQRGALASLALDVQALRDALARLMPLVQSQGARLAALEGQLQVVAPGVTAAQPRPSSPSSPQLQGGRQALGAPPAPGDACLDSTRRLQGTLEPPGPGSPQVWPPESPGESKHSPPSPPASPSPLAPAAPLHGFLPGSRSTPGEKNRPSADLSGCCRSRKDWSSPSLGLVGPLGHPQPSPVGTLSARPASATPQGACAHPQRPCAFAGPVLLCHFFLFFFLFI